VFKPYDVVVYDQHVMFGNAAILECHVPTHVLDYMRVTSWLQNNGQHISASNSDEPHNSLPPTITNFRSSVRGSQGDVVTLPCVAQGKPPPEYHWYKEHHGLRSVIRSDYLVLLETGILVIRQARVEDSGTYVCVANNSLGAVESNTRLSITAPLLSEVKPDFKMANIGETIEFTCIVNGHPIQSVNWLRNCRPLLYNSRIIRLGTNVLRIAPVERGDRGMYQCVVSNEKQAVQAAAELVLQEQPPNFLFTFNKKYVHPGSSLSLKCSASGNPLPQITWTRDGTAVPEAYHIRVGDYVSGTNTVNSYINISTVSVQDGATYACIATNGAGQAYHSERVDVYGPPFVRPMANHTVLGGGTAIFHCPVSGYPLKEIIWKKGENIISVLYIQVL
ncbi:Down syndrome cell adhesion molecule-like protein Dscam2, partial [Limulus polyphemus]|uniref:Down syndrome cell adhesion molecule-like protein Dscam2 n=1 Tax=Limulus polyphemus TaxID=6850 RepID=A0ABM1TRV7_LIMPO